MLDEKNLLSNRISTGKIFLRIFFYTPEISKLKRLWWQYVMRNYTVLIIISYLSETSPFTKFC